MTAGCCAAGVSDQGRPTGGERSRVDICVLRHDCSCNLNALAVRSFVSGNKLLVTGRALIQSKFRSVQTPHLGKSKRRAPAVRKRDLKIDKPLTGTGRLC